jgi:hypothetical protein
MSKRDMIVDFLSVKQLSNMFCEDEVLKAAACAVVLHEIGRNKEKRKKPRKKTSYKNTDKSATPNHFSLHTALKVFGKLIVLSRAKNVGHQIYVNFEKFDVVQALLSFFFDTIPADILYYYFPFPNALFF